MTEPTKKEYNCLLAELIRIRKDLNVTPNYTSDILIDYKFILKNKDIFSINTKEGATNKIEEILQQIKNDHVFMSKINIDEKKLSFSSNWKGLVKIKGYQTEILEEFLNKINKKETKYKKIKESSIKTYNIVKDWSSLKLKIKEGLEDIEIFYKDKYIDEVNYKDIGFSSNTKNHKPNREWEILILLSYFQSTNPAQATPEELKNVLSSKTKKSITSDNLYRIKHNLSLKLGNIFNIPDDNPPFDNKIKDYYKPLFILKTGERELRHKEIYSQRIYEGKSHEPLYIKDNTDGLYEDFKVEEERKIPEDPDGNY